MDIIASIQFSQYLERNKLLYSHQRAFCCGKSTEDTLLLGVDHVVNSLDEGKTVYVLLLGSVESIQLNRLLYSVTKDQRSLCHQHYVEMVQVAELAHTPEELEGEICVAEELQHSILKKIIKLQKHIELKTKELAGMSIPNNEQAQTWSQKILIHHPNV